MLPLHIVGNKEEALKYIKKMNKEFIKKAVDEGATLDEQAELVSELVGQEEMMLREMTLEDRRRRLRGPIRPVSWNPSNRIRKRK
jgi:hypothetical protein